MTELRSLLKSRKSASEYSREVVLQKVNMIRRHIEYAGIR